MSECVVCGDECVRAVRCCNNHTCCMSCHSNMLNDLRCPLCREPRGHGSGTAILSLLSTSKIQFVCKNCGKRSNKDNHERHRSWCPENEFECPIGCSHQITLQGMGRHAVSHGVPRVDEDAFLVSLIKGDTLFFMVRGVLVVLSSTFSSRIVSMYNSTCVPLQMRGYYPSPEHHVLSCTIHHHSMASLVKGEGPEEQLRLSAVPPITATHEVLVNRVPVIVPFCSCEQSGGSLVYPNLQGDHLKSLRRNGVRDLPAFTTHTTEPIHTAGLVILRFSFHPSPVGDVFSL